MKKIVILISGTGSNMAAIVQAAHSRQWSQRFDAQIVAVISNQPQAKGLAWAAQRGIETAAIDHKSFSCRETFDKQLAEKVAFYQPSLVVLAGFMRVLTPVFVDRFSERLINIHPSLLPAFKGLDTHKRAIAAGCRFAGASVHWVVQGVDEGKIIDQAVVPILPKDTAHTLAERILVQEHQLYPRAIEHLLPTISNIYGHENPSA